jgi:hypothetical protein
MFCIKSVSAKSSEQTNYPKRVFAILMLDNMQPNLIRIHQIRLQKIDKCMVRGPGQAKEETSD